jgi:hypothetical protein
MPDITTVLTNDTDYKGSEWSLNGSPTNKAEFDEGFTMHNLHGKKNPTWADLQTKLTVVQAAYDAKDYQRKRQPEYPTIGDQLDALYHAGVFPTDMAAQIKAVKDKYAKE